MAREFSLACSFIASAFIHIVAFALALAALGQQSYRPEGKLISVSLLEAAPEDKPLESVDKKIPRRRIEEPPLLSTKRTAKSVEKSPAPAATLEPSKVDRPETLVPPPVSSARDSATNESGGSATGVNNLPGGDVDIAWGSGTAGNGGGTAIAGFGRGAGAPGMPAQTGPLRTNREAKPLQTARASYPPMALRMGLEGDVMLRIEVDPAGKVTRAEIVKSGGAAFDEEALKAVRQSRFEPAQKDGQNVAAEFNYVYRFRLQR